jgi:hypothetical protein
VFWISAILALIGLIAFFVTIPFLSDYAFFVVLIAYILLFLGNTLKGF